MQPENASLPNAPRPRALIVDDEQILRAVLRRFLQRSGWEVDEATNGIDALNRLASSVARPDYRLILSDIRMPGMSGIELYARMVIEHPDLVSRMVFMSGNLDDVAIESFFRTIARPTIEKPFDLSALAALAQSFARMLPVDDDSTDITVR